MDPDQARIVILVTFFGFVALAVALLLPVYRFLKREEQRGNAWNDALRRKHQGDAAPSGDGSSVEGDERP